MIVVPGFTRGSEERSDLRSEVPGVLSATDATELCVVNTAAWTERLYILGSVHSSSFSEVSEVKRRLLLGR